MQLWNECVILIEWGESVTRCTVTFKKCKMLYCLTLFLLCIMQQLAKVRPFSVTLWTKLQKESPSKYNS